MADKICPSCGEVNPADAERCARCEAELKDVEPVENEAREAIEQEQAQGEKGLDPEKHEPGWLQNLRARYGDGVDISGHPVAEGKSSPSAGEEIKTTPEWLKKIRDRSREEDAVGYYSGIFKERKAEEQDSNGHRADQPGDSGSTSAGSESYQQFLRDLRRQQEGLPLEQVVEPEPEPVVMNEPVLEELVQDVPGEPVTAEAAVDSGTQIKGAVEETVDHPAEEQSDQEPATREEKTNDNALPIAPATDVQATPAIVPETPPVKRSFGQRLRDFFSGRKAEPVPQPAATPVAEKQVETRPADQSEAPVQAESETTASEEVDPQPEGGLPAPPGDSDTSQPALVDVSAADETIAEEITEQKEKSSEPTRLEDSAPGLPAVSLSYLGYVHPKALGDGQLVLSEWDKSHAQLIESLFRTSTTGEIRTQKRPESKRPWLRLVLTLAFLMVLLYQLQYGKALAPVNFLAQGESAIAFEKTIEALPAGAPVLVAFEYEPAYSAELSLAASPVLQQLMQKGCYLALISTVPAGPLLAEDLANHSWVSLASYDKQSAASYAFSKQLINLGYLPGQNVSLQAFAKSPAEALRAGFNDSYRKKNSLNELKALSIERVGHFAAVIVLADRFETAQPWLEQVEPALRGKPLLLVSTAQAAPLLQSYLDSRQARGLLAGMNDGLLYAKHAGQKEMQQTSMTAYYTGAGMIILAFAIGMLLQLLAVKSKAEEKLVP